MSHWVSGSIATTFREILLLPSSGYMNDNEVIWILRKSVYFYETAQRHSPQKRASIQTGLQICVA